VSRADEIGGRRRLSLAIVVRLYEPAGKAASRGQRLDLRLRLAAEKPALVPMATGTVEMVTSSITSSSSLCRIATPPSRCTRRTPLPGVPRRALQVAQSSESEALFQLGALQTTAAKPAASKAAARTRSHRRDLRTPYLTKYQPKSRFRKEREPDTARVYLMGSPFGNIEVRGAREKNLKNISLDIPRRQITVFTGV
jgi:hypothetical protein